jgi:hypothetical protein
VTGILPDCVQRKKEGERCPSQNAPGKPRSLPRYVGILSTSTNQRTLIQPIVQPKTRLGTDQQQCWAQLQLLGINSIYWLSAVWWACIANYLPKPIRGLKLQIQLVGDVVAMCGGPNLGRLEEPAH